MSIDNTVKRYTFSLSFAGLSKQIIIACKKHSSKFAGSIKQNSIIKLTGAIFVSGEHIDPTQTQTNRDSTRHILIHIQSNGY